MIGFKIKVLKSKLDSYWYANQINREYWARLDDNQKDYVVIPEGVFYRKNSMKQNNFGDKCVIEEDCEVIDSSHIHINTNVSADIIDVYVKDLHVERHL